jgi:hypothetical protein
MNRPINIAPRESWSHERIRMEGESRFLGWGVLFALIAVGFAHWGGLVMGATSSTVSPAKPSIPSAGFTPGPWAAFPRLARGVHHGYFIDAAVGNDADNGYVIADLIVGRHQEGNARLIAAAPDGYEVAGSFIMAAINEWDIPESREADEGWLCDTLGHALADAFLKAKAFRAKARGDA